MNSLLLLALVWLPAALVVDVCVRTVPDKFAQWPKKALFYAVTLPLVWLRVLEAGVAKISSWPPLGRIALWFKG